MLFSYSGFKYYLGFTWNVTIRVAFCTNSFFCFTFWSAHTVSENLFCCFHHACLPLLHLNMDFFFFRFGGSALDAPINVGWVECLSCQEVWLQVLMWKVLLTVPSTTRICSWAAAFLVMVAFFNLEFPHHIIHTTSLRNCPRQCISSKIKRTRKSHDLDPEVHDMMRQLLFAAPVDLTLKPAAFNFQYWPFA